MKAVFKLAKPAVQNPLGIAAPPLSSSPDSVQCWPPLAHSQVILSLLKKRKKERPARRAGRTRQITCQQRTLSSARSD